MTRAGNACAELAQGDPADDVLLLSFSRPDGAMLTNTPFGGKLEMMLRFAGIPYEGFVGNVTNSKHAPKRKFPVLRHGANTVADSSCISEYLRNTYPEQMSVLYPTDTKRAALALSLLRTLEEDLYWSFNYCVFVPTEVFSNTKDILLADVPAKLRPLFARKFRKKMFRDLDGQGLGRHSFAYIQKRIDEELSMCCNLLELSGAYLTGLTPTPADCYLFALIDLGVFGLPSTDAAPFAFAQLVKKRPQLLIFYERLKAQCFPDGINDQWTERVP